MGDTQPLELDGKKYISAKRAALDFGYTNDYIGQLSRSGKIDSIMVGRDRFVELDSISKYVNKGVTSSPEPVSVPAEAARIVPVTIKKDISPEPAALPTKTNKYKRPDFVRLSAFAGLGVLAALIIIGAAFDNKKIPESSAASLDASAFSSVTGGARKIDDKYLGFLHSIDNVIISFWNSFRNKTLAILSPIIGDKKEEAVVVSNPNANVQIPVNNGTSSVTVEDIRGILADVVDEEIAKTIDYTSVAKAGSDSLVITPSSGTDKGDAALKQSIKNKFSDEVNVSVDSDGLSGTIRPVFKNPSDGSYIYVLVPKK